MTDPLSETQRARVAAAYEAARSVLEDDPMVDDVIALAHWITTGHQPRLVRATDEQAQRAAYHVLSRQDDAVGRIS